MTDRTVKVSLILAAQGYMSGMDAVAQKTAQTGTEIEKLNQKRQAFSQLGAAAVGFGAAAALGVGMAISKFAEFDQQMSYVQAATHETAGNMNLLRDAALEAGARTVFSATEAAAAVEELAKAGVSTADILSGGLDAALDLAAAGGLGVADAAGIAATALKTFNLEGRDMSHVADLLAAGAGKAMGDVSQLAQALAQGGQVAKSTGLSIEETTAGLSAFAAQGLLGSDAGTSFKSMLQRLTPQSQVAQKEMDRLGISAYDAGGNFIGLAEFAGNLEASLKRLTPEQRNAALATIFGSDAVRAANVIYSEGEAGIRDWIDAVDDTGYAAETARIRLDNLAGDVEALGGAFDTALIQSGSGANDALRELVQIATGAVDVFSAMPAPLQEAAVFLGLAAAGVGLVGGAALLATPKIAEFKAIVSAAGLSLRGLTLAAGGATIGLGIVIGVVAALATEHAAAKARVDSYASAIRSGTKATEEYVAQQLALNDSYLFMDIGNAIDNAKRLGVATDDVTAALRGSDEEYEAFVTRVRLLGGEFGDSARAAVQLTDKTDQLRAENQLAQQQIENVDAAQKSLRGSTDVATRSAADHEQALRDLGGAAQSTYQDVDALSDSITNFGTKVFDTESASLRFNDALRELSEKVAAGEGSLDKATAAGSATHAAMLDVAKSTNDYAASVAAMGGTTEEVQAILEAGRQKVIDTKVALGESEEAARLYADQLIATPTAVQTTVGLIGVAEAEEKLRILTRGREIALRLTTGVAPSYTPKGLLADNAVGNLYERGKPKDFAAGGWASGIYPATPGGYHRFAEAGHDEAYITMDPKHRARSLDIWSDVGARLGAWQSAPASVGVVPSAPISPDGMSISGTLDLGDGLKGFVDGRIHAADDANERALGRG